MWHYITFKWRNWLLAARHQGICNDCDAVVRSRHTLCAQCKVKIFARPTQSLWPMRKWILKVAFSKKITACFNVWPNKSLTNELGRPYICAVLTHWLRTYSFIGRKQLNSLASGICCCNLKLVIFHSLRWCMSFAVKLPSYECNKTSSMIEPWANVVLITMTS